jgi:hypothetical protein
MASTRGKGSRSGRGGARGRTAAKGAAKKTAARGGSARAKKPTRGARATKPARARAAKSSAPKRAAGRGAGTSADVAKVTARFEREKSTLERRLTEAMREIGQLRHHEMRATQLERQLKERDESIAQLRREASELRSRPTAPLDEDPEVQPSLALGERAGRDLDDFDDELALDDEDELV